MKRLSYPHQIYMGIAMAVLLSVHSATASSLTDFNSIRDKLVVCVKNLDTQGTLALNPEISAALQRVLSDSQVENKDKLNAATYVVNTFVGFGENEQALEICKQLSALSDLTTPDRVRIQCTIAGAERSDENARKAYEQALAFPGLSKADKLLVYGKLAQQLKASRDPSTYMQGFEPLLALTENDGSYNSMLILHWRYDIFPVTKANTPEVVEYALTSLFKQKKITSTEKIKAYPRLIEAYLRLQKVKEAKALATQAKADTEMPAKLRLESALVLVAIEAIEKQATLPADTVDRLNREFKLSQTDLYDALNHAAAAVRTINEGKEAREFSEVAGKMIDTPKKVYECAFLENAPMGASSWLGSKLLNDPKLRESRFLDYNIKDAEALVSDVNAERDTSAKSKDKQIFFENTAFYMAYDYFGWHIFVRCGDPDLEKKRLDGGGLGSLEMYFAPGADEAYNQWMIRQTTGEASVYNWNSPYRGFRSIEGVMRVENVYAGDDIGTYMFFPWELFYDKLPFDTKKDWIFEMIRWSPAGGISWSGGRVHNTGKWGNVKWQNPSVEQLATIKKMLLRKAWAKYTTTRTELVNDLWASRDFGDPEFMKTTLAPEVERLNKLGEAMAKVESLDAPAVNTLYEKVMSDWMEFAYKVSELRRDYLAKQMSTTSK